MSLLHKEYIYELDAITSLSLPWMDMKNKSVLITGATGLIGSFLVDLLMHRNENYRDNITIFVMCRNSSSACSRFSQYLQSNHFVIVEQDVCEAVKINNKIDFIIHGASNADPVAFAVDPVGTMKANFMGMYNLLEFARQNGTKRTLFLSSGEVYGENINNVEKFDEMYCGYINCNDPRSCYPESKRAAESLCASFGKQHQLDVVVSRLCHVYGPTMSNKDSRVVAQFIRNAVAGKDIVLKSKGLQMRSYCYVSDAASALLYILLLGKAGHAYNVANKHSDTTIRDMAVALSTLRSLTVQYETPDELESSGYSKVQRAVLDASKLEGLGWEPTTSLLEGFEKTIKILNLNSAMIT